MEGVGALKGGCKDLLFRFVTQFDEVRLELLLVDNTVSFCVKCVEDLFIRKKRRGRQRKGLGCGISGTFAIIFSMCSLLKRCNASSEHSMFRC